MFHGGIKKALALSILIFGLSIQASEPEAVPGEYIVKLKSNLQVMNTQRLSQVLGASVKSRIPEYNFVVVKRPVFETQNSAVKTLSENELVEYVEPNYIYRIVQKPDDTDFAKLWGLSNTGQKDSSGAMGVKGVDVDALQAWNITTGSEKVLVAVIDTGIDYNHPDLVDNIWTNQAELNGKPDFDDDGNGYIDDIHGMNFTQANAPTGDPLDDHGHGTHCSGTIGAKGNDGKGIVGVAWNVKLMAVKFLSKEGGGSLEGAILAIDYATKQGAKILSNSWGGGPFSQALKEVIEESNKAGALFVAAAGNESNNNDKNPAYPASYNVPNIISVAAVDNKGNLASFSNFGKNSVHLGGPGVNIYSSVLSGSYNSWSGTSMATPHVSGVAALVAAQDENLSGLEIRERLLKSVKPLTSLKAKTKTGGMVNAYNALTNQMAPPDPNDPANWQTKSISISSVHPYKSKSKETFEIQVPGAKEFAIYFTKFETEKNYDTLTFIDHKGTVLGSMSGANNDSFSMTISGNYVKLVFQSDESVEGYGFEATKVHFR